MYEILISVVVALCYGISAAIQKYSMVDMKKFSIKNLSKNKKWLLSLALGGIGVLLYVFALRFVSLSTIQPILALTIVIPIIAGVLFFKEKPGFVEIASIILILVGVIWISI